MSIGAIDKVAVIAAVRSAANRTGVDFGYLVAQARIESGLNPDAAAPTSSARGLYQFTEGTWLDTVRRHGAEHGMAAEAAALSRGTTADERTAILERRRDPEASAAMAAAFAQDNGAMLERRLGRSVGATDLYLAHFLGPAGAVRFLAARDAAPGTAASTAVTPAAAAANTGIFTTREGRARSLDEVYARFEAKLSLPQSFDAWNMRGKPLPPAGTALPVTAQAAATRAYMLLAELGA